MRWNIVHDFDFKNVKDESHYKNQRFFSSNGKISPKKLVKLTNNYTFIT